MARKVEMGEALECGEVSLFQATGHWVAGGVDATITCVDHRCHPCTHTSITFDDSRLKEVCVCACGPKGEGVEAENFKMRKEFCEWMIMDSAHQACLLGSRIK